MVYLRPAHPLLSSSRGLVSRSPSINWIGTESDSRSAPRAAGVDWHQGEGRLAAILEPVAGCSGSLVTSAHLIANRAKGRTRRYTLPAVRIAWRNRAPRPPSGS